MTDSRRAWLAAMGVVAPPPEYDRLPKRALTILYDRSGKPFQSVATLRERINDVLANPIVEAAIAEAVLLEELPASTKLTPHGIRKNAACYLLEVGLTDEEIGGTLGMSPDMVRHYTRMANVLRIANRVTKKVAGAFFFKSVGATNLGAK